jgi:hypothetical protein
MSRKVRVNLASAVAFTALLTGLDAAWDYLDGTPIHFVRALAIYSAAGVVIFLVRQFRQEQPQQQK